MQAIGQRWSVYFLSIFILAKDRISPALGKWAGSPAARAIFPPWICATIHSADLARYFRQTHSPRHFGCLTAAARSVSRFVRGGEPVHVLDETI